MANLTFTVNDLFNTIQTETTYELYPYYNQTVLRKNQTRSIGLIYRYRLASKSMQNKETEMRKPPTSNKKDKEGKNRDENLKKDEVAVMTMVAAATKKTDKPRAIPYYTLHLPGALAFPSHEP